MATSGRRSCACKTDWAPRCTRTRATSALVLGLSLVTLLAGGCAGVDGGKIYRFEQGASAQVDQQRSREAYDLAQRQIRAGDLATARQNLEAAVRYDPDSGRAHNNLGWTYFRENHMYQAAWSFRRAIELMPRNPRPVSNLALVMERGTRWDDAVELHEQALKLDPNNPHYTARLVRAKVRRGDEDPQTTELLRRVERDGPDSTWSGWAQRELQRRGA